MTFTITKLRLAIAILVVAVLAPATALAVHSWPDVPDDKFYAEAVAWAKANGMTVGCNGGTGFCPDNPVTRGENITFAKRYDDLVVQPALTTLTGDVATNTADIATNAADIAGLPVGPTLYIARELDSSFQGLPQNTDTDLGSLAVPAGTYLFTARVLVNNNAASAGSFDCTLAAGGDQDDFSGGGITIGVDDDREIASLQFAETLATAGNVTLSCKSGTSSSNAGRVVISALKIDGFTETVINPAP